MKFYFLFGFLVSLILIISLGRLLIILLRNNWNHNNQKWFSYLFPVFLSVVIAWTAGSQLYPRFMDLVHLLNGHYDLTETILTDDDVKFNYILVEGNKYYYLPFNYDWPRGEKLQILSSPQMRYVISFTAVEEAGAEDPNSK
ncbi:MAG TPA: hypothetical protein GXX72_07665 [Clostridiaceae bacterium]|nr:hypothetical protein [Clostridiaceae bacterium]